MRRPGIRATGDCSDNFLQAVRRILDLSSEEWDIMYHITRVRVPASAPVSPFSGLLPDGIRDLVKQSPTWALYVGDYRWDVLTCNAKAREHLPLMQHGFNVMEWVFTWPEARTQLINWREEWALPMIAQLRLHAEQWPNGARLRAVISAVKADPAASNLWDAPDLPAITHPASSQPRRLYLPRQGGREFAIRLLLFTPMEFPSCRLMVFTPAEEGAGL
ncbi:MmyB family transcriptional regulator [Streptomyces pristinaespiralis]|uniref:MmyB family transcriptional regulator n=1 Tax=Streptomyces pristinaespiralis TaxID=38300 RepID=UPI0038339FC5